MKRKKNKFVRPRKLYEKARISEENALKKRYALKNKREIWKTLAKITYLRHRAMELAKSSKEEQEVFLRKIKALGFKAEVLADILNLKIENFLERRLPTIVFKNGLSSSIKHARQMVVHKKILVDGSVANIPSFIVSVYNEDKISIKQKKKLSKPAPKEDIKHELSEAVKEKEEAQLNKKMPAGAEAIDGAS